MWLVAVSYSRGQGPTRTIFCDFYGQGNGEMMIKMKLLFLGYPSDKPKWHGMSLSQLDSIESVFFPPTVLESGH